MKKILIIHTAFIGDIILATPMLTAIKNKYPDCLIDFITIPASANLLEKDPRINRLTSFDKRGKHKGIKGLRRILDSLNQTHYDVCICPHRSIRSAILTKYSNSIIKIGFNTSGWSGAYTHVIRYDQSLHEVQRNLSLLKAIDIESPSTRPQIYEDKEDIRFVESIIAEYSINTDKIIAIAPGSVWPTKRWPKENFIDFINELEGKHLTIVLIGGVKDIILCNIIKNEIPNIISFAGKMTLRQTKYFLTKCRSIISNDSAPLHLGLAANISVFSIFGPTISEFGFAPIESNSYVIENKLNCRPCGIHGSYKCPTKTFDCMEKIDINHFVEKI